MENVSAQEVIKPKSRRAVRVIAGLLFAPGAGHFAIGRYRRGIAWFIAVSACEVLAVAAILTLHPSFMWLGFGAAVAVRLASVVDVLHLTPSKVGLPGWGKTVFLWVLLIVFGRVESVLLRANLVEAFKIPAGSMSPTLLVGDHLFINKLAHQPKRGEIIVFKYPKEPNKDFIKRVIGIGGDTVEVRDNVLFVNGKAVERRHLDGDCRYEDLEESNWIKRSCDAWQETLDGVSYQVIFNKDKGEKPRSFAATQIPANELFVVGDNRDNSFDSRYWGTVPLKNVKGRALYIWWSSSPNEARWSRINQVVK